MSTGWDQPTPVLSKEVLEPGQMGKRPHFWSEVNIELKIDLDLAASSPPEWLSPFVQSFSQLKYQIGHTGHSEFCRILDSVLQVMNSGEKSAFEVRNRNNDTVSFELKLVTIEKQSPSLPDWHPSEIVQVAQQLRKKAVSLYQRKLVVDSFFVFSRALKLLLPLEVKSSLQLDNDSSSFDGESKGEMSMLIPLLYCNMAACHLQQGNYQQTIELCNQVIQRDGSDLKAIYRKASALCSLKDYVSSQQILQRGLEIEPSNQALQQLMKHVGEKCRQQEIPIVIGMKKYFK